MFDVDSDGVLNADEIEEMINILILVSKENSSNAKTYTYKEVLADLQNTQEKSASLQRSDTSNTIGSAEFTLTPEDFMMWSVQSQLNLVQPFLDLLFEVCHIVLGLRPQCKHLEYNIGKHAQKNHFSIKISYFFFNPELQ